MKVIATSSVLRTIRDEYLGVMGFVPTMGALHEGHISLLKRARSDCDHVTVSIFVNPTQFTKSGDLDIYPRDLDRDLEICGELGVDLVFAPDKTEVYTTNDETLIRLPYVGEILEGASRPGHFAGVAGVVLRLLNMVRPEKTYFGAKDAQQIRVIRRLVQDLHLATEVIECPTVRAPDGLALSSRNIFLDSNQRRQALTLSAGLFNASDAFAAGERSSGRLRALARSAIRDQDIIAVDYLSLADSTTLAEITGDVKNDALLSIAAMVGSTRLIDNVLLVV
jgi:pantoate--beta-alanine ligase